MVEFGRALLRKCRSQGGFTLPELTVGLAVTMIIAVAVMSFILISTRLWQTQEERVSTTDEARNALQIVVTELRDAPLVAWADERTVYATVRTASGTLENVRYQCTSGTPTGTCTRTNTATGASRQLLTGLVNQDNFTLIPSSDPGEVPGTVEVRFDLGLDRAENPIALSSAISPRNCSDAGAPSGAVKVNASCT